MNKYDLLEKGINAALMAAHEHGTAMLKDEALASDLFVVGISRGTPSKDIGYVCDRFGTVDGPYRLSDVKTVAAQENQGRQT